MITGGGGICGDCMAKGYLEKNVEYFSPPYLFAKDGSGNLATRPEIDTAPSASGYGQSFAIGSAQAGSIAKVGLIHLGAPTHGDDQGQRYVPLAFTSSGSVLTATTPAAATIAPPGYYMLFITDSDGVPSVAKIVKLDPKLNLPPGSTVRSDYDGDGDADLAVWRPATAKWYVRGVISTTYGTSGDQPVPADYDGDRTTDIAVWRPAAAKWYVRGGISATYGKSGDKPVPADYDGDGDADIAVWRPSTGTWYVRGLASVAWGASGDVPVPADYDGDGDCRSGGLAAVHRKVVRPRDRHHGPRHVDRQAGAGGLRRGRHDRSRGVATVNRHLGHPGDRLDGPRHVDRQAGAGGLRRERHDRPRRVATVERDLVCPRLGPSGLRTEQRRSADRTLTARVRRPGQSRARSRARRMSSVSRRRSSRSLRSASRRSRVVRFSSASRG